MKYIKQQGTVKLDYLFRNEKGDTPLSIAEKVGNTEMLVLLAKDSINPDDPKIEDDLEKMMREEEKVLSKKKKHKQQRKQ